MSKKQKAKAKPKSKKVAKPKPKKKAAAKKNPYEEKPKPPSPHPGPHCYFGCRGRPTRKWIPTGVMAHGTNGPVEVCSNCEWRAKRYGWVRENHGEAESIKPA